MFTMTLITPPLRVYFKTLHVDYLWDEINTNLIHFRTPTTFSKKAMSRFFFFFLISIKDFPFELKAFENQIRHYIGIVGWI